MEFQDHFGFDQREVALPSSGLTRKSQFHILTPTLTTTSTPTQLKSWVRHGNHQKATHHHKLKLHERTKIERYFKNKNC